MIIPIKCFWGESQEKKIDYKFKQHKTQGKKGNDDVVKYLNFQDPVSCYAEVDMTDTEAKNIEITDIEFREEVSNNSTNIDNSNAVRDPKSNDNNNSSNNNNNNYQEKPSHQQEQNITGKRKRESSLVKLPTKTGDYKTYKCYYKEQPIRIKYKSKEYIGIKTARSKSPNREEKLQKIKKLLEFGPEDYVTKIKNIVKKSLKLADVDLSRNFVAWDEFEHNKIIYEHTLENNSLVHIAAYYGRDEILEYFIKEMKINVNHQRENGSTALHEAVFHNHKIVVENLINKFECNLWLETRSHYLPLHNVFSSQKVKGADQDSIARLLIDAYRNDWKKGKKEEDHQRWDKELYDRLRHCLPNSKHFTPEMKERYHDVLKQKFKPQSK